MIDVSKVTRSSGQADALPTVSAATGRERNWVDLGGHHDKMLNNSNKALWVVGQGHIDEYRGGLLLLCII